jgi:Hexokinase
MGLCMAARTMLVHCCNTCRLAHSAVDSGARPVVAYYIVCRSSTPMLSVHAQVAFEQLGQRQHWSCLMEVLGVQKWLPQFRPRTSDMVVNTELPGFVSPALIVLPEDTELDKESNNTGQQQFEKLTSGLYMGDIARRILRRYSATSRCLSWLCAETACQPVADALGPLL